MNSNSLQHLLWIFVASFTVPGAHAQGPDQLPFYWGFSNIDESVTSIPECSRVKLWITDNNKAKLQPPFYLFAYEANGIPTVNDVGSDPDNIWWTVDHTSGSQLILTMTDAQGTSGGVSIHYYTVTDGEKSSCHTPIPTSPISVSTNISKILNTCEVLPLVISGGVKPYTLTVAALNTKSVFKVSMGNFDGYDWVNQTPPNMNLLATVIDATGTYGVSTPLLTTAGSSDTACNGLQSRPWNSSDPNDTANSGLHKPKPSGKATKFPIIAGIVGGLGVSAIAVTCLLFFLWKRDRVRQEYLDPGASSGWYGPGSDRGVPDGDYTAARLVEETSSPVMRAAPNCNYRPARKAGPLLTQNQHGGGYGQSYSQSSYPSMGGMPPPVQPAYHLWRNSAAAPALHSVVQASSASKSSPKMPLPPGATMSMPQMAPQRQQLYSPTSEDEHGPSVDIPPRYSSLLSLYSMLPLAPSVVEGPGSWTDSLVSAAAGVAARPLIVTNPGSDEEQDIVSQLASVPQQEARLPNFQHKGIEAMVEELPLPPSYRVMS